MRLDVADKLLFVFLVVVSVMQWSLFADFLHIPGPLYGGDLYRERGFVQHILNGGPYWSDPYFSGELEFYPPLGYVLPAKIVQWSGVELEWLLNHFPIIVFIFVSLACYALGKQVFEKKEYALLLVGVFTSIYFVMPKHTLGFGMGFLIFSLSYYLACLKCLSYKNQVWCGVCLGLAGLTHYTAFLVGVALLAMSTIFEAVFGYVQKKKFSVIKESVGKLWVAVLVSFVLSSFFLFPLYEKYRFATPNETQIYSLFNPYAHGVEWVAQQVWSTFFSGGWRVLLGLLAVVGLLFCVVKRQSLEHRVVLWFFVSILVAVSHFVITIPLFGKSIVPPHLYGGMPIAFSLLVVAGARTLSYTFAKKTGKKKEVFLIAVGSILVILLYQQYVAYDGDRWVQYGRMMDSGTAAVYQVGEWILANSENADVFLAHDESSFALNALTGRKLVLVRRTHASPYVDVDKRYADGFVMLYGTNESKIKELLEEYQVKYLYVDRFMVDTPMVTAAKYADYLKQHGVEFQVGKARYDPASTDTPVYDVVMVQGKPRTIVNVSTSQQYFSVEQQLFAVVYKFE